VNVKYDPRDMSRVFVRRPDGHFIEARYRNLAFPCASWWEWKHAKDRLRTQGKRDLSEETIFSSIAQQRRIEEAATIDSASARRSILKRPKARAENPEGSITGIDTAKPSGADDDMEFWGR
jgi:putative transposase